LQAYIGKFYVQVLKYAVPAKGRRNVLTPEVMKKFHALKQGVYFVMLVNIATVGEVQQVFSLQMFE
jgi:hypothetical protein